MHGKMQCRFKYVCWKSYCYIKLDCLGNTPQGWQCDIALDNIVVDGTGGGGGGPPTCATIPYDSRF